MFQFLIGRLNTISTGLNKPRLEKVSIPYRQTKYIHCSKYQLCHSLVSIPYRQTKYWYILNHILTRVKFQFLIGRLNTSPRSLDLSHLIQFQFLIGRLNTLFLLWKQRMLLMFQFLIGRLNTGIHDRSSCLCIPVSIPYRQTKYEYYFSKIRGELECFNSLQVD